MNILLLNPPFIGKFSRTSRSPAVTKGGTIYYPFWLAYAAGVLEESGFDVKLIDAPAENLSIEDVLQKLGAWRPDMAVVDTSTPSIYEDVKSAGEIKKRFPSSFVCLVGTHPSALPEETLKLSSEIDAVACGEYDYTIRDIAKCLAGSNNLSSVSGLCFRRQGEIVRTSNRPLIDNLDTLPFVTSVYKKHLNIKNYFFAAAKYPMVMIITGRGCPHRCFFCVYPQVMHGHKYRLRSSENVVSEFEFIVKNFPDVKEVGIEDDTFTADIKRVKKICDLIIIRKLKIKWYCNVRAQVDIETMKLMKKAGCRLITVGFESANRTVLNNIHKGISVDDIKIFARNAKKAGILVHGCFMAGNPGDSKTTLEENIKLAKELNCETVQFYPLQVYPGTEAYEWAKKTGYLLTEDYARWANKCGDYNSVISLPGLSNKEIMRECDRATRAYYLRPKYILGKALQMFLHPGEIKRILLGAKSFLARIRYI